jgi:hypothetical protein
MGFDQRAGHPRPDGKAPDGKAQPEAATWEL